MGLVNPQVKMKMMPRAPPAPSLPIWRRIYRPQLGLPLNLRNTEHHYLLHKFNRPLINTVINPLAINFDGPQWGLPGEISWNGLEKGVDFRSTALKL